MPINLGASPPEAVQNEWLALAKGSLHIKGWLVIGVAIVLLLIDFALLTARLWLCLRIQRRFHPADILATIGTVWKLDTLSRASVDDVQVGSIAFLNVMCYGKT